MRLLKSYVKRVYFKGCIFHVLRNVYEPAEDTFLLAENLIVRENDSVLDMGTGCGILAILAAKKAERVVAVDINPYASRCARMNGIMNGVSSRMEVILGDLFGPIREDETFDLILFNAPYLPTERPEIKDWIDYAWSGGETGRDIIDRFINISPRHLNENGRILLVQSTLSNVEKTLRRFEQESLKARIIAEEKAGFETITLIQAEK